MKTQAKKSMNAGAHGHAGFLTYPIHKVVSIFEDSGEVAAAVAELDANGFSIDDIESFCGREGSHEMDFKGTRHGIWASFIRAVQHVGPDRTYLERYEKALNEGHCLLMVRVANEDGKKKAAEILRSHTNERVTYFGLTMADEMKEPDPNDLVQKPLYW